MGEKWDIDTAAATQRILHEHRGGYCFHLNGAFARLLTALGYDVTLHAGGPHDSSGLTPEALGCHLVVTVAGLPTDANPSGHWYVDVGLGDALYEPLPLIAGTYRQGPLTFVLDETPGRLGDWQLTHDPCGSFERMSFRSAPIAITELEHRHRHLSTSPESPFVRTVTAQRRDAAGCDILRGLVLSRLDGAPEPARQVLTERADWFIALQDVFGLGLADVDAAARDRLWASAVASHEAWRRSQIVA
jgi:arylamine N-acetyltransferase